MPAHITHEIFADEVFGRALTEVATDDAELRPFWVFGAQGPDFFLHNHRTRPSGLVFGQLLHGSSYGTFIKHVVEYGLEHGHTITSQFGVFVAAFTTHAMLDRVTHPFINYYSGWVVPDRPDSEQYYHCHAFLERIIDVFVLRIRRRQSISDYDFFSHVDCGETMSKVIIDAVAFGIVRTFAKLYDEEKVLRQINNAYQDTRNFYVFTNPPDREHLFKAYQRDHGSSGPSKRSVALFHPVKLPELDYLNFSHAEWNHPGNMAESHDESFLDLYEKAIGVAVSGVQAVKSAFEGTIGLNELEQRIGNQNLSDGRDKKQRRRLEMVKPLPLAEVLHSVYMDIRKTASSSP